MGIGSAWSGHLACTERNQVGSNPTFSTKLGVYMKVKVKKRDKYYSPLPCRCCDRIHLTGRCLDSVAIKEMLEEIYGPVVEWDTQRS